ERWRSLGISDWRYTSPERKRRDREGSRRLRSGLVSRFVTTISDGGLFQFKVLLQDALALHHLQPRRPRLLRRRVVDDALLQPERLGPDGDGRRRHLRHRLRPAEDVHNVDLLRNVLQPGVRLLPQHLPEVLGEKAY